MRGLLLSIIVIVLIIQYSTQLEPGKVMEACRGKGNKTYTHHVPHEWDCHKFYKCLGGKGYLKTCPDDLVFNPEEQLCDWEENVPGADCSGKAGSPSTPSSTPSSTPPSTPSSTPSPTPPSTPSSTPSPTPPSTPSSTPSPTPPSTPSSTPSPTPPTTPSTTPNPVAEGCPATGKRSLPHKTNCHYYYMCSNGRKERCRCYENHRYNPVVGSCDLPQNMKCFGEAPVPDYETPSYGACPPQAFISLY